MLPYRLQQCQPIVEGNRAGLRCAGISRVTGADEAPRQHQQRSQQRENAEAEPQRSPPPSVSVDKQLRQRHKGKDGEAVAREDEARREHEARPIAAMPGLRSCRRASRCQLSPSS